MVKRLKKTKHIKHPAFKETIVGGKESLIDLIEKKRREIDFIFLGVGLTLFAINLTAYFTYLPKSFSVSAFYLSLFTSMILIIYAVYEIYEYS